MRIAGIVLDIYDDPKGIVLRNKIAGRELPEKLASSRLLSAEELEALPDRLFALVAENHGEVVRKYAMHDAAHVATSTIYFTECGHLLPGEVRAKVAANLINGGAWYGMEPSEALVKTALLGAVTAGLGAVDMASRARQGAARGRADMDAFRQAQASGVKTAGREVQLDAAKERAVQNGADSDVVMSAVAGFSNAEGARRKLESQLSKHDQLEPQAGAVKASDLRGTEMMPAGGTLRTAPPRKVSLPGKTAAARLAAEKIDEGWLPCGDLSAHEPEAIRKTASHRVFALPEQGLYPIDTADLVKRAAAYFDEHLHDFPLEARRIYAQSVVEQAEALGVKVAGAVLDYAGTTYGPFIDGELYARVSRFEGTSHEAAYVSLQEKKAALDPDTMAILLRETDVLSGADRAYGRPAVGFRDPYAAVFGAPKLAEAQPTAEESYSWAQGNDYVNGFMLMHYARTNPSLDQLFGKGFGASFQKDPIGIFKSMPDPQKVVLSRLAADNSSSVSARI
jgi:hypothetical protein